MNSPILNLELEQHPSAAIRPEPFGALVYHYDTRRLHFLKDERLARVIESLGSAKNVRSALTACGVDESAHPAFGQALERLMTSNVIRTRKSQ